MIEPNPLASAMCHVPHSAALPNIQRLRAQNTRKRGKTIRLREIALKKALKSRTKINTIKEIAAEPGKFFVAALRELDIFRVLDALDETIQPVPRDDKNPGRSYQALQDRRTVQ